MDDRKCFLTPEQLEIFLDFKEDMASKIPESVEPFIDDNAYCRYLVGYKWNLKVSEENLMKMTVSYTRITV